MRGVVVLGLGNFGSSFVRKIKDEDVEILCADSRPEAVDAVAEWVSRAVVLDVTDRRALEEVGAGRMDVGIVSLGDRLDATILSVLHLKSLGVREICVKALSDDHARILELIGATRVIHPEREIAEQLAREIAHPRVMKYLPLVGSYAILEVVTPSAFHGKTLAELHLPKRHDVSVIAMSPSGDPKRLEPPSIDLPIEEGCLLVLIGEARHLERFQDVHGG